MASALLLLTPNTERTAGMLLVGMIVLGLAAFAAMLAFIEFCDRV
jgi:hypothetical protein